MKAYKEKDNTSSPKDKINQLPEIKVELVNFSSDDGGAGAGNYVPPNQPLRNTVTSSDNVRIRTEERAEESSESSADPDAAT